MIKSIKITITHFQWNQLRTILVCRHVSMWGFQNRVCLSVCLSIHLSVPREKKSPWLRQYQSYISNWYINGRVFTSTTPWKPENLIFFQKSLKLVFWFVLNSWNHHSFVNISPTLVIDTSIERSSRVLQQRNSKIWIFSKKNEIEFWLVPKSWNHPNFVNISPTIVIDTSMERSSRVLQHGNIKIWFLFKKNWNWISTLFCLTCFLFKFEIEFWLIFLLVPKRWNHSRRSQQAPIWRHRGCIVVPSRVDI